MSHCAGWLKCGCPGCPNCPGCTGCSTVGAAFGGGVGGPPPGIGWPAAAACAAWLAAAAAAMACAVDVDPGIIAQEAGWPVGGRAQLKDGHEWPRGLGWPVADQQFEMA